MNFPFFIAQHIYRNKSDKESFARPAIVIAMAGIAVGIVVILLSLAIVLGFKKEVSGKVVGFNSHIQVLSPNLNVNNEVMPISADNEFIDVLKHTPDIKQYQFFASKTGLVKTDEDFKGVQIKGIGEDYNTGFLKKYLIKGTIPFFSADSASNKLLISQINAEELKLDVDDKVLVYFFDSNNSNVRARKFVVSGIYNTHLEEYDNQICVTDIYTVRKLNNWKKSESTGVEIQLNNDENINYSLDYLIENVNHNYSDDYNSGRAAYSMYDLSPAIFSWLDILDMNVVMILVLMLVIGAFTVMAGLLIVMLDRIQMIGILKALGCPNLIIRRIFTDFAIMMVGKAIIVGDILGIGLCYIQQIFSLVKLDPSTYYIDNVPIDINWLYVLLVNVGVVVVTSIIIFGSSFFMKIKEPARTMKWN